MRSWHLSFLLGLVACEPPPASTAAVPRQRAQLEQVFEAAAREYQVPVELLKGIAWVETRVSVSAAESASGSVGLLQIPERPDWRLQARAQGLLGVSKGQLALDPAVNVRAAAALLRELFDRTSATRPLDARRPGDWYEAVALYPGFTSAEQAADWASDVFRAIEQGFEAPQPDGLVVQAPRWTSWLDHAPAAQARRDGLGDYPGRATYVQSPNFSNGRTSYEFIVIHTMQGSYAGSRSWFLNTSSNVSAHYLVRSSDGEITQMVEHADTAWHAQCYNGRSIGIEHEGYVQDPARWYTDAMYTESAKLTRYIADRHGIPKTRQRIIGHVDIPSMCNTNGHTDPGSGWNWTRYMALVTSGGATPGTGTLIGVIYTGGSTANRVAGATVSVNGQSVTTGADGLYQFQLAPGTYTATVTRSGFSQASVSRAVTTGAQTWGSMEVNPVTAQNGTLSGVVYAFNAANPADQSMLVSGAAVAVAGQMVTTAANGAFSFMLPPGTHTVTVTRAGSQQAQATRTVVAGQTVTANVGLMAAAMPDTRAPEVVIESPQPGAMLDLAVVTVAGTASDDRGAVAEVTLSVNGVAQQVPVSSGRFQADVKLTPGSNALVATARDAAGNEGRVTRTASFLAGVTGTVTKAGDGAVPLAGATAELREASSGAVVASATTDAQGGFSLAVTAVPRDYTLTVRAAGHRTSSETLSVPDDRRLVVDVALVVGEQVAGEASLRFIEPTDGAQVMTDSVTLYGQVLGFDVAGVQVNGRAAELVGAGGFSASVPLTKGPNVIDAVATGVNGESVSGRLTVVFQGTGGAPEAEAVVGSCASVPGPALLLAVVLVARGRRRRGTMARSRSGR